MCPFVVVGQWTVRLAAEQGAGQAVLEALGEALHLSTHWAASSDSKPWGSKGASLSWMALSRSCHGSVFILRESVTGLIYVKIDRVYGLELDRGLCCPKRVPFAKQQPLG